MNNDNWSTPPEVFHALDLEFGFGFDVCAEHTTAKCPAYWTIEDDALGKDWARDSNLAFGKWLWVNPPYSKPLPFIEKAIDAQLNGVGSVMLIMCDPSTRWFAVAASMVSEIRFITNGRLAFYNKGVRQSGNNKGSVIFVFDPHRVGAQHVSFVDRDYLMIKGALDSKEQAA